MTETPNPKSKLRELLDRPRYLPRPSREEIVGAAILELHVKLTPFRRPAAKTTT